AKEWPGCGGCWGATARRSPRPSSAHPHRASRGTRPRRGPGSVPPVPLTVTNARREDRLVGLRAEAGVIVEIGPDVVQAAGDGVLDAGGDVLLPGLVNGHTHAAMTLMRGYGGDLPLMTWLSEKIWPAERRLTADAVYWGTRLACCEMIRTGTVRFWDM